MEHGAPMSEFLGLNFNLANVTDDNNCKFVVFIFAVVSTRRIAMKPTGMQNFMEWVMDFVKGLINSNMDWKDGGRFSYFRNHPYYVCLCIQYARVCHFQFHMTEYCGGNHQQLILPLH